MTVKGLPAAAGRSLTLLRVFLVASAAILLAGAAVIAIVLTSSIREQAISDRTASLEEYVDGVLRPRLVDHGQVVVGPIATRTMRAELRRNPDLISVKVWRRDGVLAWTNRDPSRIGRRFELDAGFDPIFRDRQSTGAIEKLDDEGEDSVEAELPFDKVLEVYAPILDDGGRHVVGAYEIYGDPARLNAFMASRRHLVWGLVLGVFLALYAALAVLVRGASSMLSRQTRQLRESTRALLDSYGRLERSSLEAIEALNATVDAKDTYTAGHSQRVQRISIVVGRELDLDPKAIDVLRFGGLFHDIGKIGVPDAILTKPGPLTDDEFEVIRKHPTAGAEIVSRFGRLRPASTAILHHHERWDGRGYPAGLSGSEIPIEAAVVGIADAWDAMTTERPYSRALTHGEALAELRACRGTQFHPAVVDAFLRAIGEQPEQFAADEPSRAVA
jgi:putative nucleotidyltransferase with HDIG domain